MELVNSRGAKRVRKITQKTKDYGSVEKKIMTFTSPADVRGTSFMNWSYTQANKDDDQWIYLPALRRVTRISSESTSDYFMGSDFTYDDLGDRHPSKDRHTIVRTETINGQLCTVIDSTSIKPGYMYSRTRTWVTDKTWLGVKREFYDRNGRLLKTLSIDDTKLISGFWVIVKSKMHNVQRNHTTIMSLANVRINTGVADRFFTTGALERGL
jgi:outer membrane lipoprotein-sorting protein